MTDIVDLYERSEFSRERPAGHLLSEYELDLARQGSRPLTIEERLWCLDEIEKVEGYERGEYEHVSDRNLAENVFSAWLDYCRDKGLI